MPNRLTTYTLECFRRGKGGVEFLAMWPVGKEFQATVDPDHPDRAYVDASDDPAYRAGTTTIMWMWLAIAVVSLPFSLGLGIYLRRVRYGAKKHEARTRKWLLWDWSEDNKPVSEQWLHPPGS